MNDQPGKNVQPTICVDIPKALYKRVEVYCKNSNAAQHEFILDAISEKLASVHKERRKKLRL